MNDSERSTPPFPDLPTWLWVLLAPVIFLAIPFIVWSAVLISEGMRLFGASEATRNNAFTYAGILVVPPFGILILVATVGSLSENTNRSPSSYSDTYDLGPKPDRPPIGDDVAVRGYIRSDGTYVDPHFRTRANHTELDNYSTYPNVNPYTNERGTNRIVGSPNLTDSKPLAAVPDAPSLTTDTSTYSPIHEAQTPTRFSSTSKQSSSDYDRRQRQLKADALAKLGYEFSPNEHTWSELYDFEQRIRKANQIVQLGVDVDWRSHTWNGLYDMEQRIRKSQQITELLTTARATRLCRSLVLLVHCR